MAKEIVLGFAATAIEHTPIVEGISWAGMQPEIEQDSAAALASLNRAFDGDTLPVAYITSLGKQVDDLGTREGEPLALRAHELQVPTCVVYERMMGRSAIAGVTTSNRRDISVAFDVRRPQALVPDIFEWLNHVART